MEWIVEKCNICGQPVGTGWGWCSRLLDWAKPIDSVYCYEAAWKAEKERADDLATPKARPIDEWHEDHGPALWWRFPVTEPPYCGTPLDDDFPDYVTHWTPFHVPEEPTP